MNAQKKGPAVVAAARGARNKVATVSNTTKPNGSTGSRTIEFLSAERKEITGPLSLIDGRAYAIGVQPVKAANGKPHDLITVARDDGALFTVEPVNHPSIAGKLESIGLGCRSAGLPLRETISAKGMQRMKHSRSPTPAEVFTGVSGIVDHYVDFAHSLAGQRTMCELTACWIMASYFTASFDGVGYIWATGSPGSGKTQLLATLSRLAFLGRLVLGSSSYAATRDAASWGATMCFDDNEILDDPIKRELILAGSRRGAKTTIKVKVKDAWENVEIDAFTNRAFSAQAQPDSTPGSRCIVIPMVRSSDSTKTRREPMHDAGWPVSRQTLIDNLWILGLKNLPNMRQWWESVPDHATLIGRDLDAWRGTLAIALWLQTEHGADGLFDGLNALSREYQEERATLESSADPIRLMLRVLLTMMGANGGPVLTFDAGQLAEQVNARARDTGVAEGDATITNAKKIGWELRRLRVFHRTPRDKMHRPWAVSRLELENLARAYGVSNIPGRNAGNAGNDP